MIVVVTGWHDGIKYQRCVPLRVVRAYFPRIRPGVAIWSNDGEYVVACRFARPDDFDEYGEFVGDIIEGRAA